MIENVVKSRKPFTQADSNESTQKMFKLDQEKIDAAQRVPSQGQSVWSCGPNQIARAMSLLSMPVADYSAFMEACPRVCGPGPLINEIQANCVARWLAKTLLFFSPIGPPPKPLSLYATQQLQGGGSAFSAKACQLGSFVGGADKSMHDSLARGVPWLALIGFGPLTWHYWTIVACDDEKRQVQILETNQTTCFISYDKLEKYMEFTSAKTWVMNWAGKLLRLDTASWLGTFNCIEFHTPDNASAKPIECNTSASTSV